MKTAVKVNRRKPISETTVRISAVALAAAYRHMILNDRHDTCAYGDDIRKALARTLEMICRNQF